MVSLKLVKGHMDVKQLGKSLTLIELPNRQCVFGIKHHLGCITQGTGGRLAVGSVPMAFHCPKKVAYLLPK